MNCKSKKIRFLFFIFLGFSKINFFGFAKDFLGRVSKSFFDRCLLVLWGVGESMNEAQMTAK